MLKLAIECDGCGEQGAAGPWKLIKGHQLREGLKAKGWEHKDGEDMCPQCITILKETARQRTATKNCKTCQGKGWIYTFSTEIPKEGSDRCPDCKGKE